MPPKISFEAEIIWSYIITHDRNIYAEAVDDGWVCSCYGDNGFERNEYQAMRRLFTMYLIYLTDNADAKG